MDRSAGMLWRGAGQSARVYGSFIKMEHPTAGSTLVARLPLSLSAHPFLAKGCPRTPIHHFLHHPRRHLDLSRQYCSTHTDTFHCARPQRPRLRRYVPPGDVSGICTKSCRTCQALYVPLLVWRGWVRSVEVGRKKERAIKRSLHVLIIPPI